MGNVWKSLTKNNGEDVGEGEGEDAGGKEGKQV
jgi:hypothetical protein